MQRYKGIKIPTSGRDWQLFTTVRGVGEAAKKMTKGLKKAITELTKLMREERTESVPEIAKMIGYVWKKHIETAMARCKGYGATDTEPRYRAAQALIDKAKQWLGMSGYYMPELGDWI
jgi:hypothetical protein